MTSRRAGWQIGAALSVIAVATTLTFWPVRTHEFVNWDDPDLLVDNESLRQSAGAVARWAFTTRHMGHYQPLSWLAFAGAAGNPPSPSRVHTFALALHVANAMLLCWLTAQILECRDGSPSRWWAALAASVLFAVHPLRVEPVAWAAALPYLLSATGLLVSLIGWVNWTRTGRTWMRWWSVGLFAVSQLSRVTAPLFPLALLAFAPAIPGATARPWRAWIRAVVPFVVVVLPLAIIEASAREPESLDDIGVGPRVAWAVTHPVHYLWRSVVPGPLNPLDPLPRAAAADWPIALLALFWAVAILVITIRLFSPRIAIAVWGTYGLLLAPFVGLVPSGLQVTADRYTYLPAMVLSAAIGVLLDRARRPWPFVAALVLTGGAASVAAFSAHAQLTIWHDSVSLWSRAVALNADNDVAFYNLALAEIDHGRSDAAIEHLTRLVALVPDHDLGRTRLDALVADRELRTGEAEAAAGHLPEAIAAFDRVLARNPARTRARRGRGMAALQTGDVRRAAADLAIAVREGEDDPAVVGALAFAWMATGRGADAVPLLTRAVERHPADAGLANNLARLLVTVEPASLREPARALELATRANDATGGRDPRVLDTLALALAATGRRGEALSALDVAASIARDAGDVALAEELTRRRRTLPR